MHLRLQGIAAAASGSESPADKVEASASGGVAPGAAGVGSPTSTPEALSGQQLERIGPASCLTLAY